MKGLISKDILVVEKLASSLDKSVSDILKLDAKTIASEFLSCDRAIEQIELFKSIVNKHSSFDFHGKKLLEIGAGVGTFLIVARNSYGIEAYGIEPSTNEFSAFKELSSLLLSENGLAKDIVVSGEAEELPFSDNSFDLIYSSNVLEHVKDPRKVLSESIRVLKPGGYLQFVIPNYFSFWEGHYGIFWPCITNKFLANVYLKLILRNPSYINTIQLINPIYLQKNLNSFKEKIEVVDWGKDVFKNRLKTGNYSDWASLRKIRPLVELAQKLKLSSVVADLFNAFNMYTPIVLTIKKR